MEMTIALNFASGVNTTMKSPKRVAMKNSYEQKEMIDNDGSCFSPKSLFALPSENSFLFTNDSPDQDLLLHVPSNSSFPQAELFLPTASFAAQASTSSSSIYPHHVQP